MEKTDSKIPSISIVIPAHNEEKRIGPTLRSYGKFFNNLKNKNILDYEIIVVINNTQDKTLDIVKKAAKINLNIKYLDFKQGGKGFAIIEGFKKALKSKKGLIGFVDADASTSPVAYYDLIKNIHKDDAIIASRYLKGSVVNPKQTLKRIFVSRVFNLLIKTLFLMPYKDTQCGAKILTREATEKISASEQALRESYALTIEGWAKALELRDGETARHSKEVVQLCVRLGRAMGLSKAELEQVYYGAHLHDIGKLAIRDGILLKPGPLSPEEWEVMRTHPAMAKSMLEAIPYLRGALAIPYGHHERWDGSGYPQGLRGEDIPLAARIFAVVDVWDALTNDRPYRKAWSPEQTRAYIIEQSGKQFDPAVVEKFLRLV